MRKAERLRKRPEFLKAQREGQRRARGHFIVYARPTGRRYARLGVTASRRVGNARRRNWWKRRVREIFRRNKVDIPIGFDYVVIVKASASRDDYAVLAEELIELFAATAGAATPN
ncbi:MAG: ribonuclease P protein component [Persicimonas sp.]